MKHRLQFGLVTCLAIFTLQIASAQTNLNFAAGYYAEETTSPGFVLELERDKFHSEMLSIPIQLDLIGVFNPDYTGISLELKTGYRIHFNNGLFVEQNIGLGYQFISYNTDVWYFDKYNYGVSHGDAIVPWFLLGTSAGLGYDLSREKAGNQLIWFRPKLFWMPGFRGINLPYHAFQIGYTFNLKTKE